MKSQPNNGNYNLWYGVCCLNTGEAEEAIKYLETAVKRRATSGQLFLAQAYNATYRFEDAVNTYEDYIAELAKGNVLPPKPKNFWKRVKQIFVC